MNTKELVGVYIRLRDRRSKRKAEFEASDAGDKAMQDKIEQKLMAQFNEDGSDSVKTEFGTAYKSVRTSATVADWDTVLDFIKVRELWNMLEHRVSKTAVEQFIAENEDTPPGVNITQQTVINVRRS